MGSEQGSAGALAGLRVLDLSRILAGPWCTQILGDLGADVIKIEKPGVGDDTRHWGPPFLNDGNGQPTEHATYYTCCNRNKRSVTIDLAHPQGQALIRELALQSDVLVENFKVGGLAKFGLDAATLRTLNPRLIYCSITGFGHDGPYAERAGYDLLVQASSGMMSITGVTDGEPGAGPMRVGVAVTDLFTGVYAASAILAALHVRHGTGQGQHIDMALLDVGIAMLANQASTYLNTGIVPQRQGNSHPSIVPYQDFPTADGAMLLAVGNDGQFRRFCEVAGEPQWADDARFAKNVDRVRNRATLIALMNEVTRQRSTAQWVALLEDKAVPCGPINDIGKAFDDPQVGARGLSIEQAQTRFGRIAGVASPLRLSDTPPVLRHAPPHLGEHTTSVLREVLGLVDDAIASLRAARVI
jgi:crotonobetainyl-CoA:carnitine CoA-transferase CaiB-like acyl-CoA transferase